MCNAWNHPAHCPCGWGGLGNSEKNENRQASLFNPWPKDIPQLSGSFSSLTIPNASCPVCGESVFYYCNIYGSSVFFDELGPPWPKHPCTDNGKSNQPKPPRALSDDRASLTTPKWQKEGWEIFKLESIKEIDRKTFRLQALSSNDKLRLTLYTLRKKIINPAGRVHILPKNLDLFIRNMGNGAYQISALTESLIPIKFETYDSRIELHGTLEKAQQESKKAAKKSKPKKTKKRIVAPTVTSPSLLPSRQ